MVDCERHVGGACVHDWRDAELRPLDHRSHEDGTKTRGELAAQHIRQTDRRRAGHEGGCAPCCTLGNLLAEYRPCELLSVAIWRQRWRTSADSIANLLDQGSTIRISGRWSGFESAWMELVTWATRILLGVQRLRSFLTCSPSGRAKWQIAVAGITCRTGKVVL